MKIKLHPLFLIFSIYLIIVGNFFIFFQYLICVIFHELCHGYISEKCGYKLDALCLMPYGASLNLKEQILSEEDEIKISVAGPICNLIFCIIILAMWWIFPVTYSYTYVFFIANLMTFLFNLLPAYPMDGGRIFFALISKIINRKFAIKLVRIFNIILSILMLVLFLLTLLFEINFTLLFASIFILLGAFDNKMNGSYSHLNILSMYGTNKCDFPQKINMFAVNRRTKIIEICRKCKSNSFNMVYVVFDDGKIKTLGQKQLFDLILSSLPNQTIEEVFRLKENV